MAPPISPFTDIRARLSILAIVFLLIAALPLRAATGGSISGTLADSSGAAIPGAILSLVNISQRTSYQAVSDRRGLYSFPNLPVGHYELTISAKRFATQRKTNLTVDTDSALRVDAKLAIATQSEVLTVTSSTVGVQLRLLRHILARSYPAHR
ncbi:carboxypeptidase-like regulatory domain-containing protein [Tunturiibacter gelidiferens]|uniref:carboxypeptidase-like regulatory domain-containing protein n=1 Tax=Tunturiibacter gelidiferens TaxID=3069689 RepID=UPI003D9B0D80